MYEVLSNCWANCFSLESIEKSCNYPWGMNLCEQGFRNLLLPKCCPGKGNNEKIFIEIKDSWAKITALALFSKPARAGIPYNVFCLFGSKNKRYCFSASEFLVSHDCNSLLGCKTSDCFT